MISREAALTIAKAHAMSNGLGRGISQVLLPEEITWRKPRLYNVELNNCWVAYVDKLYLGGLESSVVIIVNRDSGAVVFAGDASDEG